LHRCHSPTVFLLYTMPDVYTIKVPVFEGPLDLLLHLIKENKIDIYDIPIALITRQYLEYLELMKELNLEIASEFVVMAATLIYIKSRMLLPVPEDPETPQSEDPRKGLVNRLLEYQAYKEASLKMRELEEHWANVFIRETTEGNKAFEPELRLFDLTVFDMLTALKRLLTKMPPESMLITRESLTLRDKINFLLERLNEANTIRFEDLFSEDSSRIQVIVTFLALLEVIRLGIAKAYQEGFNDVIWIIRKDGNGDQPQIGISGL